MAEQDALTWAPETFKAWRKWMGWTQMQAANGLGVARSTVSAFEDGTHPIDRRTALACTAFRMARFLAGEGKRFAAADQTLEGEYRDLTAKMAAVDAMA